MTIIPAAYFVDPHELVLHPELLEGEPKAIFVVPWVFREDLDRLQPEKAKLISNAASESRVVAYNHPSAPRLEEFQRLSETDQELVFADEASRFSNTIEKNIIILTDRLSLKYLCQARGLEAFSWNHYDKNSSNDQSTYQPNLSKLESQLYRQQRSYLIWGFFIGVVVTAILALVFFAFWYFKQYINDTFPIWSLVVFAAIVGTFLFWFRSRYRLSYGIVETLFGLFAVARYARPSSYDTAFFFQIAAGLYIIVRGLDNIEKGLQGSQLESGWRRFFGGIKQ